MIELRESAHIKISVAMCTFNGAKYLRDQLKSLLQQERLPDEVVICDDQSTDETLDILDTFSRETSFPVHIYRNRTNLGYSRNFTQAIDMCTGEVIALSDQDDIWYPQKLARLAELFMQHSDVGGIFTDGDLINTASEQMPGHLWGSFSFDRKSQRRVAESDGISVLLRRNVVTGMAFAFRSEWRETLKQMPSNWPHDSWLALMLAWKGRLLPWPERLVAYRVHGTQQIGVPISGYERIRLLLRNGPGYYLALSRERNLREYNQDAVQFESLIHETKSDGILMAATWLPMAAEKALHMRRCITQLHTGRLSRSISALAHWNSYRLYAPRGLKALVRDLIL